MAFFVDAEELHRYVGGFMRLATDHPRVGPRLRAADTSLRLLVSEPECELTVVMGAETAVLAGACDHDAEVTMHIRGDLVHRYCSGEYDLVDGLARGDVTASGRLSRVLKVLPELTPLFPVYRAMVAAKPATRARHTTTTGAAVADP